MRSQTNRAVWRQAQTYAFMAFISLGAVLLGAWMLSGHISTDSYRDMFRGAIYVACYIAILCVRPLTDRLYSRLMRR